jgi:hypothetical protein
LRRPGKEGVVARRAEDLVALQVQLASDPTGRAREVLPSDEDVPVGARRDGGGQLVAMGGDVDQELAADLRARVREGLGRDRAQAGVAAVLAAVLPRDHEAAIGQGRHGGRRLIDEDAGVDQELAADAIALRVQELALDRGAAVVAA